MLQRISFPASASAESSRNARQIHPGTLPPPYNGAGIGSYLQVGAVIRSQWVFDGILRRPISLIHKHVGDGSRPSFI